MSWRIILETNGSSAASNVRVPLRPLVLLVAVCAVGRAQAPETEIRADVPLVLAPVTVTDKQGHSIDGLTADDFRLTDDGASRKIRADTSDTVVAPVSLMVLIQSSGIAAPALARIARVGGLIKPLVAGERGQAAVATYDREVRGVQDFTTDSTRIQVAFEHIRSVGNRDAHLFDAVAQGVKMLETRPLGNRRIMLIIGESRDRGSTAKLGDIVEQAQRAGVAIYFGTYSAQASTFASSAADAPPLPGDADYIAGINEVIRMGRKNAADALARGTGGRHLAFLRQSALEDAIGQVGAEIHSQYLLSFVPVMNANTGFHPVQVAVPSRPDAVIRVRPGYWARK